MLLSIRKVTLDEANRELRLLQRDQSGLQFLNVSMQIAVVE